jgi:hypothetical protein
MLDNVGALVPEEPPVIMCGWQDFLQQQPTVQSESDDGHIPSIPLAPYPYPAPHQAPVEHIISPHCRPLTPDSPFIPGHPPSSSDLMLDDVSVLIPEGSPICGWQGFHQRQATVQPESDDGYIPSAPLTLYPYPAIPVEHIISPSHRPPTPIIPMSPPCGYFPTIPSPVYDPPFVPTTPLWDYFPAIPSPPSFISPKRYEEGEDHFVRRWQKW